MNSLKFIAWPTESRAINQYFGENRYFNYRDLNASLPGHEGIDVRASQGSRIFVVADGEVSRVGRDAKHAYGLHVRVRHAGGYSTIYGHLSRLDVSEGQWVAAGQMLGLAGSTGNSTGPHLHLTLKQTGAVFKDKHGTWPSNIINPEPYLLPLLGLQRPAGPYVNGWVYAGAISMHGSIGQANDNLNMRAEPSIQAAKVGTVPLGTTMIITGGVQGDGRFQYYPVQVPSVAFNPSRVSSPPKPTPKPDPKPKPPPPPPIQTPEPPPPPTDDNLVAAWAFTTAVTIEGNEAIAGKWGLNLRAQPRRNAAKVGIAAEGTRMTITGSAQGEYTPITIKRSDMLPPTESGAELGPSEYDPVTLGAIRIGIRTQRFESTLHAAARANLIRLTADDALDEIKRTAHTLDDMTYWLHVSDPTATTALADLRFALAQSPIVVELGPADQLDTVRAQFPATSIVERLPIQLPESAGTEGADGVVVQLPLVDTQERMLDVLRVVEETIRITRYQPVWVVLEAEAADPLEQAANFLMMWGALQQHPVVQGVVLQLAETVSAADALKTAEIIGWR